jgi:hypothetical protein
MAGGGATITLTAAQYSNNVVVLSGSLSEINTYVFPNIPGSSWFVDTTGVTFGAYSIKLQVSGGSVWLTTITTHGIFRIVVGNNTTLYGQTLTS